MKQFGLNKDGYINLELSRQDLAAFAASTYETVFRVIIDLTKENLVAVSGKQIRIIDRKKLAELTTGS